MSISDTDVAKNVKGIVFLGTPHGGSSHAIPLATILSVVSPSNATLVKELVPACEHVADINEIFVYLGKSLHLLSFYETQSTYGMGVCLSN